MEGITELLSPVKYDHRSAITAPAEVGNLMREIIYRPVCRPVTTLALQIMTFVFVRSWELRGAHWSEIDFETATWIIPASRMKMRKEHMVPLAR